LEINPWHHTGAAAAGFLLVLCFELCFELRDSGGYFLDLKVEGAECFPMRSDLLIVRTCLLMERG